MFIDSRNTLTHEPLTLQIVLVHTTEKRFLYLHMASHINLKIYTKEKGLQHRACL